MNRKSIFALKLFALAAGLGISADAGAQQKVVPPPQPTKIPDLVISSLSAKFIAPNKVQYSWTITNVGTGSVNMDGPTANNSDNLSVQAMVSKDTVFGNAGDVPAGGTIIGVSPLGNLAPVLPETEVSPPPSRQTSPSYLTWSSRSIPAMLLQS